MSRKQINQFINELSKESRAYDWVKNEYNKIEELKSINFDINNLKILGLNIELDNNNNFFLKSKKTKIKDEIFCIVDIESSGGINSGQIIEIGAIKIQNNKEIDFFESFIKIDNIPKEITELTGITNDMLTNAPSLSNVLNKFKMFIKNSIFVAHNVRFDYEFISKSLDKCNFGILLNRYLCTIELAKRTIKSQKYGLDSLKEILNIKTPHHRALSDARAAGEILKYSISKLPFYIKTTEELISFSKVKISKENQLPILC